MGISKRFFWIVLISVAGLSALGFGWLSINTHKTAYINIAVVYEGFEFKKELTDKATKVQQTRQGLLDTLEFNLRLLSRQIEDAKGMDKEKIQTFELKREEYLNKKKLFEEDTQKMIKEYDAQILTQLTQYVKDYGEKHGYTYIYGANGEGAIMYANPDMDITEAMKVYVNERYKGKAK